MVPLATPFESAAVQLLNGVTIGVLLALAAIGLTLIFGYLQIINFAHGSFYMLGGYTLFTVVDLTGSFWLGLIAAPLLVGVLSMATEKILLRPTYDLDPITQMLIMVGVALVIEGSVLIVWGEQSKGVDVPAAFAGQVTWLGVTTPVYRLFLLVTGIVLIGGVWGFLRFTRIGLFVRASLDDKQMVRAFGVDIDTIYMGVFAGGVALAAVAGALTVPIRGVSPVTGTSVLLDAFIIVVIGGLGSFRGSIVAGLGVGILSVLITRNVSTRLSGLVIFLILIAVLVLRPRGLFGQKGVFADE